MENKPIEGSDKALSNSISTFSAFLIKNDTLWSSFQKMKETSESNAPRNAPTKTVNPVTCTDATSPVAMKPLKTKKKLKIAMRCFACNSKYLQA